MAWNGGNTAFRCGACQSRFGVVHAMSHFAFLGLVGGFVVGIPAFIVGYLAGSEPYALIAFWAVVLGVVSTVWPPLVRSYVARFVEFERL